MTRKTYTNETAVEEFLASAYASSGVVPGVSIMRERLGGGSFTTLQKIRTSWIAKNLPQHPAPVGISAVINEENTAQLIRLASNIFNQSLSQILAEENKKTQAVVEQAENDRNEAFMRLQEKEEEIKLLEQRIKDKEQALSDLNSELVKRAEQAAEERGLLKEKINNLEKQNIALESAVKLAQLKTGRKATGQTKTNEDKEVKEK